MGPRKGRRGRWLVSNTDSHLPLFYFMPKARYWCFTYNNPAAEDAVELGAGVTYITWQLERGENGTIHWQGYFELCRSASQKEAKELLRLGRRAHIEPSRSEAAIAYCHKEDTRIDGPWELGRKPSPIRRGERTELSNIGERIKTGEDLTSIAKSDPGIYIKFHRGLAALQQQLIAKRNPEQPCALRVYIGSSGSGKSRSATEFCGSSTFYQKDGSNKWWCGYAGEKIVWIDEWNGSNEISPSQFLQICDRYPLRVETKGGSVQLSATTVVLTSTQHWGDWYKGTRWWDQWLIKVIDFQRRMDEYGELIRTVGT
jgi:hypothetical protein